MKLTQAIVHIPKKIVILLSLLFLCLAIFVFILFLTTSPRLPQGGIQLEVKKGMSMQTIAHEAKAKKIVRSETLLYLILAYAYDPTTLYAGIYTFTETASVFSVAKKLASEDFDTTLIRLTIPEGSTRKDIAHILSQQLPTFDTSSFLEKTKKLEGYLFPDTYYIASEIDVETLINELSENFAKRVSIYIKNNNTEFTEYEILILASILEKEANDDLSMRTVSGILQNRLAIGMALQTDATVGYVLDKPLQELLPSDLELDTPYNTYLYNGLPPTPIGNPGVQAISAVISPQKSNYLYYITGNDGIFYYAKTFEEHKQNIARYLQ